MEYLIVDKRSTHGRQPFYETLVADGRHAVWLAQQIGFDAPYVQRVAHGRTTPSPAFKDAVAAFFGEPAETLFTPSAFWARYQSSRPNARGAAPLSDGAA